MHAVHFPFAACRAEDAKTDRQSSHNESAPQRIKLAIGTANCSPIAGSAKGGTFKRCRWKIVPLSLIDSHFFDGLAPAVEG